MTTEHRGVHALCCEHVCLLEQVSDILKLCEQHTFLGLSDLKTKEEIQISKIFESKKLVHGLNELLYLQVMSTSEKNVINVYKYIEDRSTCIFDKQGFV